ncbi:30S ribosomal protein S8 [Candidatus Uhrbacteria bacterium]|nr:30S ribosomal protein S8 [Candidatus Uhrbacteria bacterium]
MITDPISDMLTRIRNAQLVKKTELTLPYSKIKFHIAKILQAEGYIEKAEEIKDGKFPELHIVLKYDQKQPIIRKIKRVSKPGNRVYAKSSELPRVLSDIGIAIISTPNGLMTNKEARARRLGGEVICEIS